MSGYNDWDFGWNSLKSGARDMFGLNDRTGIPVPEVSDSMGNSTISGSDTAVGAPNMWEKWGNFADVMQKGFGAYNDWQANQLKERQLEASLKAWNANYEAQRLRTNDALMRRNQNAIASTGNNNAYGYIPSMEYTRNNSLIPKASV